MICPACQSELSERQLHGLAVHECGDCMGLWVSRTTFDKLVDRASSQHQQPKGAQVPNKGAPQPVGYRKCPECSQLMSRKAFLAVSKVVLDECVLHGRWLDATELDQVAAFVLAGGAEKHAAFKAQENEQLAKLRKARAEENVHSRLDFWGSDGVANALKAMKNVEIGSVVGGAISVGIDLIDDD